MSEKTGTIRPQAIGGIDDDGNLNALKVNPDGSISINTGGSGGSTITEAQVTSAIENADLSAIASQTTLAAVLSVLNAGVINTAKSITVTGSGAAVNALIIPSTDISDYSVISFQLVGTFVGSIGIDGSNDGTTWFSCVYVSMSSNVQGLITNAVSPGVFNVIKQSKFIRIRVNTYTSGTLQGTLYLSNISGYSNPLNIPTALSVDTELPASSSINDSLGSGNNMPFLASLGMLYNNGINLIRWRTTSQTTGEGVGRAKVTGATESFVYISAAIEPIVPALVINLGSVYEKASAQLIITSGSLTSINWKIQGSFNGTKWFDLESSTSIVDGSSIHSSGKLFQYIRAVITVMTGSSPNVSIIGGAY